MNLHPTPGPGRPKVDGKKTTIIIPTDCLDMIRQSGARTLTEYITEAIRFKFKFDRYER